MRVVSSKSSSYGTAVLLSAACITRCGGRVCETHVSVASNVVLMQQAGNSTWSSSDDIKWSLARISYVKAQRGLSSSSPLEEHKYEEAVY
jgi:hypothetical protein